MFQDHSYRNSSTNLTDGVGISEISKNSPAEKAGLIAGDTIIALDGEATKDVATLRYKLYKHSVGDKIEITYVRSNKTYTTKVTLAERASSER